MPPDKAGVPSGIDAIDLQKEAADDADAADRKPLLLSRLRLSIALPGSRLSATDDAIGLRVFSRVGDRPCRNPWPFFRCARSGWVIHRQSRFVVRDFSFGGGGRGDAAPTPRAAAALTLDAWFRMVFLGAVSALEIKSNSLVGSTNNRGAAGESFQTASPPAVRFLRLEARVLLVFLLSPSPATADEDLGLLRFRRSRVRSGDRLRREVAEEAPAGLGTICVSGS